MTGAYFRESQEKDQNIVKTSRGRWGLHVVNIWWVFWLGFLLN